MAVIDKLRAAAGFPRKVWDRRTSRWGDIVERVALGVAFVFIFIAMQSVGRAFDSIQDGRRTSQSIICATNSAVIDAGRAIITGQSGGGMSSEFEQNLRKLGYPPRRVRQKAAQAAARAYGRQIAAAIQQQVHVSGVVREDGTLDCNALARVTNTK